MQVSAAAAVAVEVDIGETLKMKITAINKARRTTLTHLLCYEQIPIPLTMFRVSVENGQWQL